MKIYLRNKNKIVYNEGDFVGDELVILVEGKEFVAETKGVACLINVAENFGNNCFMYLRTGLERGVLGCSDFQWEGNEMDELEASFNLCLLVDENIKYVIPCKEVLNLINNPDEDIFVYFNDISLKEDVDVDSKDNNFLDIFREVNLFDKKVKKIIEENKKYIK